MKKVKVKYDPRKVWVALEVWMHEGSEFLGAAENMDAAKSICGSGRKWKDSADKTASTAKNSEYHWYHVFETDVQS